MKKILVAVVAALVLAGCVANGSGPGTSAQGWQQIAVGVGTVIGSTKADAKVAKSAAKLAEYCDALRAVSTSATIFSPEKYQKAAAIASVGVTTFCDEPPTSVATALTSAADTYAAVVAVQKSN